MTRRSLGGWAFIFAGIAWLSLGAGSGAAGTLLSLLPGILLIASGTAMALWIVDEQIYHEAALASFVAIVASLFIGFSIGPVAALTLALLSIAAFVLTGFLSARDLEAPDGVPEFPAGPGRSAGVAADELVLRAMMTVVARRRHDPHREEVERFDAWIAGNGYGDDPASYHLPPPPIEDLSWRSGRFRGTSFEVLTFESGYAPRDDEPGRDRWLAYEGNRQSHARVLRHPGDEPRPWILCVHGLGMGWTPIDFAAFPPDVFHRKYGLNVVYPVLPFHGPRRLRNISGEGFFSRNVLDTVHAGAQIAWDLRRLLAWVRGQGASKIGVYGLSLGGYSTALLASLEPGIDSVIAGIPASNLPALLLHHAPPPLLDEMRDDGVTPERLERLLAPVSPLALEPRVPRERLAIFGGTLDRIVPPTIVHDLWRHWDEPETLWYPGAHLACILDPSVRAFVGRTLKNGDMT